MVESEEEQRKQGRGGGIFNREGSRFSGETDSEFGAQPIEQLPQGSRALFNPLESEEGCVSEPSGADLVTPGCLARSLEEKTGVSRGGKGEVPEQGKNRNKDWRRTEGQGLPRARRP